VAGLVLICAESFIFTIHESRILAVELKPQELLVLFKVAANPQQPWTYAALAEGLFMSVGEVHASVKRATIAGLAVAKSRGVWSPLRAPLLEFAIHGARYAFPAIMGTVRRGVPTSFGASPLSTLFNSTPESVPVWPHGQGTARGPSLSPIYRTAPDAALAAPALYECLALLDALRAGRARERDLAKKLLSDRLLPDHAPQ
jgi:hypothetical protein